LSKGPCGNPDAPYAAFCHENRLCVKYAIFRENSYIQSADLRQIMK
jgi:hypothetical protein